MAGGFREMMWLVIWGARTIQVVSVGTSYSVLRRAKYFQVLDRRSNENLIDVQGLKG
jgi:hypothetical protein